MDEWSVPRARREGGMLRAGGALLVHVPLEPAGLNGARGLLRMGWRARRAASKRIEGLIAYALAGMLKEDPIERARVTYLRSYRSRPLDPDNLNASVKPVLDALQRLGVIRSDAPEHLELDCGQASRAGRGPFFQLEIRGVA